MTYVGQQPATTFDSGIHDRFTGTTGTTVTLSNEIATENDIIVFVNAVKQDSNNYSVGGTGNKTLTLGGTLVSADIVEVHYLNKVLQSVNPTAGSVGLTQLSTTGTPSSSNFLRGDNSWAAAGGGLVKQVVTSANTTADTNSTTSYEDSGNSIAITPSTSTNKVLVHFSIPINLYRSSSTSCRYGWKVLRGSTVIASGASTTNYGMLGASAEMVWGVVWNYTIYDEPDSTSAQTYKVQFANHESGNLVAQVSSNESNITAMEIESS